MRNGTQNNENLIFGKINAKSTRFHGYHIFSQVVLTKSRYVRNWPTFQILAKTDTALLRKRALYILARVMQK